MPQHQSACKDGQRCQHSPKGQVKADKSQLTASQPRKENRLLRSRIKVANEFRSACAPPHSCGETSPGQCLEPGQCICNSGGVCRIEFMACVASSIHHDLFGHGGRPFHSSRVNQLLKRPDHRRLISGTGIPSVPLPTTSRRKSNGGELAKVTRVPGSSPRTPPGNAGCGPRGPYQPPALATAAPCPNHCGVGSGFIDDQDRPDRLSTSGVLPASTTRSTARSSW